MQPIQVGQLPAIRISAPDGARADITLYGAHLVSWQGADGHERMFMSRSSWLDASRAIRGGVPVIFPQFAARGAGMRHGFARVSHWRVSQHGIDAGRAWVELVLGSEDLAAPVAAAWPHPFGLTLRVEVGANQLSMQLEVDNPGTSAFPFAAALHSYLLVSQLNELAIDGVAPEPLQISDKLDAIYAGIEQPIQLRSGGAVLIHQQSGFPDAVVWNPGAADSAALADMDDDEYQHFVCIEPALPDPILLAPGARWRGSYVLTSTP